MSDLIIGIDEAGRGPLAGPVCVGAVLMPAALDWREAFALITRHGEPKLRDSKKMSAQQREILYAYITEHGAMRHAYALVEARAIDQIGIVNAVKEAAVIAIRGLNVSPEKVEVQLDAGIALPALWRQQSFVKGDERFPAIAFASIIAKVTRDRHMDDLALKHPAYGFDQHKGYGTRAHLEAIRKHGVVEVHRKTFLGSVIDIAVR